LSKTSADVRILLVDDNEPFRRFVASALHDQPNLHVIAEVGDGFEAVRQAEALQPDLILLDIGLPGLNGIGAARRIAELAPNARIILLTQESSTDMVREALSLGAWGNLIKVQAGKELLVAVEMVMQGSVLSAAAWTGTRIPPRRSSSDGVQITPSRPCIQLGPF
jgi:DNA-binding NarL/FixJ family response regulator